MRLTFLFLLYSSLLFSQKNDFQLAYQFYQNSEYEKAIEIYKRHSKSSNLNTHYQPYFQSLVNLDEYKEASILSKKMIRRFPYVLSYQVDLYVIQQKGEEDNALITLDNIFDKILKFESQLVGTANTFIRYQKYEEALECYNIVRLDNPIFNKSYYINIAQIYHYMNKDKEMVNEYLLLLQKDPSQKNMVVLYLERYLENNGIYSEKNYALVKNGLLEYAQKEKTTEIFSELLIWLFMKNNEFELAFLQAKSIDKRLDEDGERLYNLAETYLDNKYYDLAIKSYDYIIDKGKNNYYFIDAQINKLYAMGKLDVPDLDELDKLYQSTIYSLGKNRYTILLMNNYAYFKAFSLGDLVSAQRVLEEVMEIPQISKTDLAECKLIYTDIMLLSGNIWRSLLYCSQIEKEYKEHPIGHEAKLRRAKISYYQGDFKWAQTQLDILKSSTSKLISNDAMYLSLLISDNLNLDTSSLPMEMYARADLFYYQKDFLNSIQTLDSIINIYPAHTLIDEIYYKKYKIYYELGDIDKSITMLEEIKENYSFDILYDDALFSLANIYEVRKNNLEKAFLYYEMILFECGGSIYTAEARKKYRKIRGDDL